MQAIEREQGYEADEEDDVLDERIWTKANPMLEHGVVSLNYLRTEAAKARARPELLLPFTRYHGGNRRVSSSEQLVSRDEWMRCNVGPIADLDGCECYGGVDWGWVDDLSALVLVFPREKNGERGYAIKRWIWMPRNTPHHDVSQEPWATWVRQGHLILTDGAVMDPEKLYALLPELAAKYKIRTIAYDPSNAREFAGHCTHIGVDTYGFPQKGAKYNEPIKEFALAVRQQRIMHEGDPVLSWSVSNLVTKSDEAGYRRPDKKHSKAKIDPVVALLMGLSEAMFGRFSRPKEIPEPIIL